MNGGIFDLALSHTRRSDALEIRQVNSVVALGSLLNVFACGQVSSPRLYRLNRLFYYNASPDLWIFHFSKIRPQIG